ncbi:hypothetical protein [Pendulispora albinea]|uniref:Tryptophan synthase alpha chain n=1 Tax=Pendulispora albinea TaxID=2741071 RepID=A0ABZ2M9F4_9BACT
MSIRRTALFLVLIAAVAFACGSSDNAAVGFPGGDAGPDTGQGGDPGGGIPPLCRASGKACTSGDQCCTGTCDPTTQRCTGGVGTCGSAGATCGNATDCCNLNCVGGKCGASACVSDGEACTGGTTCCSGKCDTGTGKCAALNTTCKTAGNSCSGNDQCCSKLCQGGTCALASSYCIQTGDACARSEDCCGGMCNIASGASLGTCSPPPTGATNCNGGVDGTVCDGCGSCCSRLCAPYGASGVKICRPANGCHVNGDLCRADKDCCGAAGSGLPGDGNVVCDKEPGAAVGVCRNPRSCNPEGNVCHFKDYVCGGSSSRNDCCGHLGSKTNCELDPVGVPRCHAVGSDGGLACRQTGETCAFSGNCCNGALCVPDASGTLRCAPPTTKCSASGGACSVNADCCSGLSCTTPPGSVSGTCGATTVPDGGTNTCALYGQACGNGIGCCNNVPCINGLCVDIIK